MFEISTIGVLKKTQVFSKGGGVDFPKRYRGIQTYMRLHTFTRTQDSSFKTRNTLSKVRMYFPPKLFFPGFLYLGNSSLCSLATVVRRKQELALPSHLSVQIWQESRALFGAGCGWVSFGFEGEYFLRLLCRMLCRSWHMFVTKGNSIHTFQHIVRN